MAGNAAARVTIVGVEGTELDLTWLHSTRVQRGVHLEVVDTGHRMDVVVSREDDHVALLVDVASGQILAAERRGADEDLWLLALDIAAARGESRRSGEGPSTGRAPRQILFRNVNWPISDDSG